METVRDLKFYEKNAQDDFASTPISVLRYISELEETLKSYTLKEKMYSAEDMKQFGLYLGDNIHKLKNKLIDDIFNEFEGIKQ